MLVDGSPAVVRGVNVVGLRRAGMPAAERRVLQDAYRLLYRAGLAPQKALERIRSELPALPPVVRLSEFIAGARHGVCGPPRRGAGEGGDVTPEPESERGGSRTRTGGCARAWWARAPWAR